VQDEQAVEAALPAADRVLHSDPHDFAGLYIRHRASFTLHARRYLRDARDADEVVQEAFLRLFLALPELETELQALAYCRRTITNLCIDRFRAQARRPSLVDLESAGAMDLAEDDPGDPVVRAEDAAMVRAALSLLSPLHRAALVKREIEEKPLPVIAEELEIPEDSVKHVLFRARRALRRILASTSLAPGSDAEIAQTLGKVMRASSGGVAAFLLLLVLGLGTGPDLRAVPVVGADLPELIPVTDIVAAVGSAVASVASDVAEVVTSGGDSGTASSLEEPQAAEPLLGVVPSPSPSPSGPASSTPAAATVSPEPSPSASPSTERSPSRAATSPSAEPSSAASPSPSPSSSAEPSPSDPASPSPSSEPSTGSSSSPSSEPSSSTTQPRKSGGTKKSPSPSPASSSPTPARDPDAYQTDGLEWAYDVNTNEFVLVPIGSTAENFRDY
jgi:RNA polymerase sigma factor (sigma-70 family)